MGVKKLDSSCHDPPLPANEPRRSRHPCGLHVSPNSSSSSLLRIIFHPSYLSPLPILSNEGYLSSWEKQQIVDNGNLFKKIMVMEIDDVVDDDRNLFSCAICGLSEGDASNLTTQNNLQTNATVGCGHQLYVDRL